VGRAAAIADAGGPIRSAAQERVDDPQNKLASVIANAELALEVADGPARARLEAILRSAWTASDLAAGHSLN
jgi:hypothetical protein